MDRLIPFLAAVVGLVALAGAVAVQMTADARTERMAEELGMLRVDLDALAQRANEIEAAAATGQAPAGDDGTIDAMLALQDRMNRLEEEWASAPQPTPATASAGAFSPNVGGPAAVIDPSWPTDNCIPMGTRFMVATGDEIAICQSPVVVKVSAITADNVMVDGPGVITETAFKPIPGSNCMLTVLSADEAGFAEMRVACQ